MNRHDAVSGRSAFTLTDVLVSLVVIAVLMSIMLPSLNKARNTALQLVCGSNVRQQGLSLMMYAEDYHGALPESKFVDPKAPDGGLVNRTVVLREGSYAYDWDGMGHLYGRDYLNAPQVYFCPAHTGDYPYKKLAPVWNAPVAQIVGNYQYRGETLSNAAPEASLVTDSLRSKREFNHGVGSNVLRADFSVSWLSDSTGSLRRILPDNETAVDAAARVDRAWTEIDKEFKSGG